MASKSFMAIDRSMQRCAAFVAAHKPRHAGLIASVAILAAAAGYGAVKGEHVAAVLEVMADARDAAANAAGFGITSLAIAGHRNLSDTEVLRAAGVTNRTSLLFLDVASTRRRLEATPWVAHATVRKLYPGRLEISVQERDPFGLWQSAGKLFVIAADGTVLGPYEEGRSPRLPLFVGPGAAPRAQAFLAVVDRYPEIREQLRASVLVAERRWNLKLRSGLEIRLPESGIEQALDKLIALERDKKLLSRDLTAIDLRLPDRVSVRLSDDAAQAREQAQKDKDKSKTRRKGGPA